MSEQTFPPDRLELPAQGRKVEAAGIEPANHSRRARAAIVRELADQLGVGLSEARDIISKVAGPAPAAKVYFICRGEPAPGVPVKIGVASDPWARMEDLQVGSPEQLVMFLFVPGGRKLESELHQRFAADHIRGEWFRLSKAMYEFALETFAKSRKTKRRRIIGGCRLTPAQRRGDEPLPDPLPEGVEVVGA